MHRRIDFHGRLDGRTELGDGSVRFTARLTRTGVFDYGDHKELRLSEDVFKQTALDSFRGIAVTAGHIAWIDAKNWHDYSIGHVGDDVHQDGDFVVASLVVKDAEALAKIDAKELVELSMGYSVDLDRTPGRTDAGEEYDAIQRNIRGNHAALGPANWGRAGVAVKLLDGATYAPINMTIEKRIDAPGNTDQTQKDLEASRAESEALRKERDAARADAAEQRKRADTLEAERDAARTDANKVRTDAVEQKKGEDVRVEARIALLDSARAVLGKDFDAKGKSDREVRIAALQKVDSKLSFDGKSDDYVTASFDIVTKRTASENASLADVNAVTTNPQTNEDESPLAKAQKSRSVEIAQQAAGGAPAGALTR